MKRWYPSSARILFVIASLCTVASAQVEVEAGPSDVETYAWMDGDTYRPPDFEGYFPDSAAGALALKSWWEGMELSGEAPLMSAEAHLRIVRNGLRRFEGAPMPILRWVGNTYIWGKSPQHPDAIELMYHGAECGHPNADDHGTRGAAIYFGLSVVRPKSDAILRTLVDISIQVDDPNDLGRIAWGLGDQRERALEILESHVQREDATVRDKGTVVGKIFRREIKAFDWAAENQRVAAQAAFGAKVPELCRTLRQGTFEERREALDLIEREGITSILDDTHLNDFAACAADNNADLRSRVARLVGERWIWTAPEPHPGAIDLLLHLSEDTDRRVRYNAVYFGLSAIKVKDQDVLRRLMEIAFTDREPNMYRRIVWGVRAQREQTREVLDDLIARDQSATAAHEVYGDMTGDSH